MGPQVGVMSEGLSLAAESFKRTVDDYIRAAQYQPPTMESVVKHSEIEGILAMQFVALIAMASTVAYELADEADAANDNKPSTN